MSVFVLDKHGIPLMPCTEKRARLLLSRGRARVHRILPFVIRLTDREAENSNFQSLQVKLDPGSKTTGVALARTTADCTIVLNLFELTHRGSQISEALTARSQMRRHRRNNLRYRVKRFSNRGNQGKGWLAPSLMHRVHTTVSWVKKLQRWAPVSAIAVELVRFDMQKMQNPEISGVEYQQGELAGYEVKEYLLAKWGRKCAYCDKQNIPLEIEHIKAKSKGGTNRVSNLTLACRACNQKKNAQDIRVFLKNDSKRLHRILTQIKVSLRDSSAVNATRRRLVAELQKTELSVETASGGRTKFNRIKFGIPKTHALDAVCVGGVQAIESWNRPMLMIKCTGRGRYQRTLLDQYGFPRGYLIRQKRIKGFQTGDMIHANVTKGKRQGRYSGRVAIRATGNFDIQTQQGVIQGISHRYCKIIQRGDGYGYQQVAKIDVISTPLQQGTIHARNYEEAICVASKNL